MLNWEKQEPLLSMTCLVPDSSIFSFYNNPLATKQGKSFSVGMSAVRKVEPGVLRDSTYSLHLRKANTGENRTQKQKPNPRGVA